jgi:hypothetical protein
MPNRNAVEFLRGQIKIFCQIKIWIDKRKFVMRRGPKPETPSVKANGGTFRPHRDQLKVEVVTPSALPVKPDWLSAAGELIWEENVDRAAKIGVTAHDSVIFTIFCNLTGEIAQTVRAGKVVSVAAQTEVRRLAELLGMAGPKSRVITRNSPPEAGSNPFARRRQPSSGQ